ncbi:MAG: hypothetical protein ACKPKO_36195, partial [Candidatus Fonsibacter sp.]
MVNQGYECLMTDMSAPVSGSLLTSQGLLPREHVCLEDATTWFFNIWNCNNTILDMCGGVAIYNNVVMMFLERSEYHLNSW